MVQLSCWKLSGLGQIFRSLYYHLYQPYRPQFYHLTELSSLMIQLSGSSWVWVGSVAIFSVQAKLGLESFNSSASSLLGVICQKSSNQPWIVHREASTASCLSRVISSVINSLSESIKAWISYRSLFSFRASSEVSVLLERWGANDFIFCNLGFFILGGFHQ